MTTHKVVPHADWIAARKAFMLKEKEFTRLRDELSEERRALPWERVEKNYVFDTPEGKQTLAQLFDGKSQLLVYHFMFDPAWEAGCKSCSFWADNIERNVVHLRHRDVAFVAISRAERARFEPFKKRMGWTFKWVSSAGSDFNYDFQVSFKPEDHKNGEGYYNYTMQKFSAGERPGVSVFLKDHDGTVYHTYSCYARGLDMMNAGYQFLDLMPKGRDEDGLSFPMAWVRHRDSYER